MKSGKSKDGSRNTQKPVQTDNQTRIRLAAFSRRPAGEGPHVFGKDGDDRPRIRFRSGPSRTKVPVIQEQAYQKIFAAPAHPSFFFAKERRPLPGKVAGTGNVAFEMVG